MTEPRPRILTPEMGLRAATSIATALVERTNIEGDAESLAKDIAKYGRQHMDGYELAKELDDRAYWSCDLNIADELDGFSSAARHEIEAAEKEWAARNNLQPPFPIGTHIKLIRGETGEITGIYEYGPAKYLVAIDGDPNASLPSNSRRIVNFEDAIEQETP